MHSGEVHDQAHPGQDEGILVYIHVYYTLNITQLLGRNRKKVTCKMHAFLQNASSFELLYSGFVPSNIQRLYIQKVSYISLYIFPTAGL